MNELVRVYWNSRKKLFSIQSRKQMVTFDVPKWFSDPNHDYEIEYKHKDVWRVTNYANMVRLTNCKFVVREAGRQRVLKDHRKNVHAWIEGHLRTEPSAVALDELVEYDPYRGPSFMANRRGMVWASEIFAHVDSQSKPRIYTCQLQNTSSYLPSS